VTPVRRQVAPTPTQADINRIAARLDGLISDLVDVRLRAGFVGLPGDKYNTGESVAEIAASHEYGLGVPRRPFMTLAIKGPAREQIVRMVTADARQYVLGNVRPSLVVRRAGIALVSAIKGAINSNLPPPNSPETIAAKRSSQTLIDTGVMINSVRAAIDVAGQPPEVIG
jgi:hypothetical protein